MPFLPPNQQRQSTEGCVTSAQNSGTARIVCGAGSVQLSGVRLSVRPSACPSVCPSLPSGGRTPLLRVCCREPGDQKIPIDCCTAGGAAVSSSGAAARRAAAYAGSGTLSADVES